MAVSFSRSALGSVEISLINSANLFWKVVLSIPTDAPSSPALLNFFQHRCQSLPARSPLGVSEHKYGLLQTLCNGKRPVEVGGHHGDQGQMSSSSNGVSRSVLRTVSISDCFKYAYAQCAPRTPPNGMMRDHIARRPGSNTRTGRPRRVADFRERGRRRGRVIWKGSAIGDLIPHPSSLFTPAPLFPCP